MGLIAVLRTLPGALVAPVLAVMADRAPRRVMVVCALVRAGVMAALAGAAVTGAPLWVINLLVVVLALASPAYAPALVAMIPQVSRTPLELASANLAQTTVNNIGFVAGSLLTGSSSRCGRRRGRCSCSAPAFALAIPPLLRVSSGGPGAVEDDRHAEEGAELVPAFARSRPTRTCGSSSC